MENGNELYLYYVGFQHVQKAKFYAFTGLAISDNHGETFVRYSEVPVLDRTDTGRFGRCIHTVIRENGVFKCWDSEMACYPVKCIAGNRNYSFYNGNGMGKTGVGYGLIEST